MAITGAAAIAGIAAGTVGGVSTAVIVGAGLALTAVGMITKTPWLSKIGGGLSMGGGIGGAIGGVSAGVGAAAADAGAAGAATDATTAAIAAPSAADAAGAGAQAAGNVAENTMATVGSGAPMGYGGAAAATDVTSGLASTATDAASGAASSVGDAASALSSAANPAAAGSIDANLAAPSLAQSAAAQGSSPAVAAAAQGSAPTADSIGANLQAASQAPGGQAMSNVATAANNAVPGTGAPMGFGSSVGSSPVTGAPALDAPSSFFGKLSSWWGDLDSKEKLGMMQMGAGLVQGVGKGALDMMAPNQVNVNQQQLDARTKNMSAAAMPTVGFSANPNARPYANTATITPQFSGPTPMVTKGLINGAKG